MVKGITNAKAVISGGNEIGDTVYAINQTGKELKYGDKVWINKHNYDRYDTMSYYAGGAKTLDMFPYCYDNGDIVRPNGEQIEWLYYDSDNKTWTSQTYAYSSSKTQSYLTRIEKMGDYIVKKDTMSMSTSADEWFIFKTKMVNMDGKILRENLLFKYAGTSKKYNLIEIVNPETGELGQTYSTITATGTTLSSVEVSGNVLLIIDSSNNYTIYNISDLANPTALVTGKLVVDCVRCLTGLNVGDYIFVRAENDSYLVASGVTSILKIAEDYTLITADDLPSEFYEYMADGSTTFFYNKENNTLTVGNSTSVNLYKWENGVFNKLSYNIPLPTDYELYSGYGYMLFTSDDLSTASIVARRTSGSSSYFGGANVYKMINDNDEWYAEDYIHSNPITVTGIATGNTDDEGRVEVELSVYYEECEDTGGASSKYGLSLDNILGDVDENGVYKAPTSRANLNFIGVKEIDVDGFKYAFRGFSFIDSVTFPNLIELTNNASLANAFYESSLTSISFPVLSKISGSGACNMTFWNCKNLTSVDLSGLTEITTSSSCSQTFGNCTKLENVNLSNLKKIGDSSCSNMFYCCSALKEIEFTNLERIDQDGVRSMFAWCTALLKVSFPKLTLLQNNSCLGNSTSAYIFNGCSALTEIHFRADMQSQIEAQIGYSSKFGATNATIYFDL